MRSTAVLHYPHGDSNPGLLAENQKATQPKPLSCQQDTISNASGCTSGCTKNPELSKTLTLGDLAAALVSLSAQDRAKLAEMLRGEQGERTTG
jgi:hypothetical protein